MISHGLIAAMLFFLAGVTYDRTHTLSMDKMGGLAKTMPKTFALFTVAGMASLALPGMSGFIGELTVFVGVASSDMYSSTFKIVVILLSAIGLIATPIYLLSMLRQVFYGKETQITVDPWLDIQPREIAIAACLLLPIVGIGFYPKVATQTYDVKTVDVAAEVRNAASTFAQQQQRDRFFSGGLFAPQAMNTTSESLLSVNDLGRGA
jgi:NAD(P)H-quinone oxidoreductase subunit 4